MTKFRWFTEFTAWAIDAELVEKQFEMDAEWCRDYVIREYLKNGDTQPLADCMARGYSPGLTVMRYLAWMLHPADGTEDEVPFQLTAVRRGGKKGKHKKLELSTRDYLLAEQVKGLMDAGSPYDGAIKTVSEKTEFGEQTVRDAYDKLHGKK